MSHTIRFVLALHNHQPIGNFSGVMEQAYQESYRPFLDVFERYPTLKVGLHTSGSLMEWIAATHPEYLDRLGELVAAGRVEIIGGAFYEPILAMIPRRDRIGQITSYTRWLEQRLDTKVRGMWIPERVWEQSFVSDLATAGIQYTVLDDFHFKNAGLTQGQLDGYYVTEDDGQLVAVFPGSERLRYLIPFASPQETIDHLGWIASQRPGAVVVFGDDGEKFGTWPETHKHVYTDGWLTRFFDLLVANESWIKVTTLGEAVDDVPPLGKIFLPDSSYREMTEWALPAEQLVEYERLKHELEHDPRWPPLSQFVKGGFWRNFKVKYPESDEMYTRMLMVSHKLEQAVEAVASDFNLDARQEVFLANDKLATLLSPYRGGMMYELDVRSICLNLLGTLARRPEAYHRKVLAGPSGGNGQVASIHDRVVFKQPGLDQRVQYDTFPRKSLLDHFFANETSINALVAGQAEERGDFLQVTYEARVRRSPHRIQVQMARQGVASGRPVKVTKGV